MIDDIVLLPRRLTQFRQEAEVTSELVCFPPISGISRSVGYNVPDDSQALMFGTVYSVPTWNDTWFRFKMIENTPAGIVEYFCISESPIELFNIKKSASTLIFCLWVNVSNPITHKQRKYMLWRNVQALYGRKGLTPDVTIETAMADEIRAFAWCYGKDELIDLMSAYPTGDDQPTISEVGAKDAVDTYLRIYSNVRALENIYDIDGSIHAPDAMEVFRGTDLPSLWSDLTPLKRCTVLRYLVDGPVVIRSILFLFSSRFALHGYQRRFNMRPLPDDTEVSIVDSENPELFSIIEYSQTIPYGEFELTIRADGTFTFVNYNPFVPYGPGSVSTYNEPSKVDPAVRNAIEVIRERTLNRVISVNVARSWAEEAYITIVYADGVQRRFYVDLSIYGICSRYLLRDYRSSPFGLGL